MMNQNLTEAAGEAAGRIRTVLALIEKIEEHTVEKDGAPRTKGYNFAIVTEVLTDVADSLDAAADWAAESRYSGE